MICVGAVFQSVIQAKHSSPTSSSSRLWVSSRPYHCSPLISPESFCTPAPFNCFPIFLIGTSVFVSISVMIGCRCSRCNLYPSYIVHTSWHYYYYYRYYYYHYYYYFHFQSAAPLSVTSNMFPILAALTWKV